jgi:predicted nucleotidyltransferase
MPDIIRDVTRILVREGRPSRIILFGSHARGDARPDSDLDLLVIVPDGRETASEMVRLRGALSPLRVFADVIVVDETDMAAWGQAPGNVLYEALREGRILYDRAAI